MRKLKPVLKAHESRMIAKVGEDGRDRLSRCCTRSSARTAAARTNARANRPQACKRSCAQSFAITSAGIGCDLILLASAGSRPTQTRVSNASTASAPSFLR